MRKRSAITTHIMREIFTEDQIRLLEIKKFGGTKVKQWSEQTIKNPCK